MGLLYLEDKEQAWAEADDAVKHIDSNSAVLTASNTVTLINFLSVKGGGFMAKRVTAVRNILLVPENAEHIEGCINGQQIVILTEFVKKPLNLRRCDPSRCYKNSVKNNFSY